MRNHGNLLFSLLFLFALLFSGCSFAASNSFTFLMCNQTKQQLYFTGFVPLEGSKTSLVGISNNVLKPQQCTAASLVMSGSAYLFGRLTFAGVTGENNLAVSLFVPIKTYQGTSSFQALQNQAQFALVDTLRFAAGKNNQLFYGGATSQLVE